MYIYFTILRASLLTYAYVPVNGEQNNHHSKRKEKEQKTGVGGRVLFNVKMKFITDYLRFSNIYRKVNHLNNDLVLGLRYVLAYHKD